MAKMINYSDIANDFKNNTLRNCLEKLTKKHGVFELNNLDKSHRHMVYKMMKYPLQFEKIITNDKTNIKIWNEELGKKNTENEPVKETETQSNNSYSEESNEESDEESNEESDEEINYYGEDLIKIQTQLIRVMNEKHISTIDTIKVVEKKMNRLISITRFVMIMNIIFYGLIFFLDPVRLEKEYMVEF